MSKDKNFNNLNTAKNTENQFSSIGNVQKNEKDISKRIKLTNSLTTDYYNTFR